MNQLMLRQLNTYTLLLHKKMNVFLNVFMKNVHTKLNEIVFFAVRS